MTSFLRKLFAGSSSTLGVSRSLLFNCKSHASSEQWFTRGLVSSDFRSKHSMLVLHVWMIHKRLLGVRGKAGLRTQECLFDELWEDTGMRIRQMGIPELSVNKYLGEVQGYSFKTCVELDEAYSKKREEEQKEELAGALWRSVYNKRDEVDEATVLELASYVHSETASLALLPDPAVLEGRVAFSAVPAFAHSLATKGAKRAGLQGSSSSVAETAEAVGASSSEWQEAFSSTGKPFWYNQKTRETTWEKPISV